MSNTISTVFASEIGIIMSICADQVLGIHTVTKTFKKAKDVIELAMVNGNGEILFHEWFDPPHRRRKKEDLTSVSRKTTRPESLSIPDYSDTLSRILKDAKVVAAYPDDFHLAALHQSGFDATLFCKRTVNVARLFADNFIEPGIEDMYWFDDDGRRHKRKLGVHPSYVTMFDAVWHFPTIGAALGSGDAHNAVWGAAASAFLFIEMSTIGIKGTTKYPIRQPESYKISDAADRYTSKSSPTSHGNKLDSDANSLIDEMEKLGLNSIDKRHNNGCLWVIGGLEISEKIKTLKDKGYSFHFKPEGGKATKGLPAWWIK